MARNQTTMTRRSYTICRRGFPGDARMCKQLARLDGQNAVKRRDGPGNIGRHPENLDPRPGGLTASILCRIDTAEEIGVRFPDVRTVHCCGRQRACWDRPM